LTPTIIAFYKNNNFDVTKTEKSFAKIKKIITEYIKLKKLLTKYKLSFRIDKELSCFGLVEDIIIQIHDMDMFISHIIKYKLDDEQIEVKSKQKMP
jgi:glutathionylspermidine synthase